MSRRKAKNKKDEQIEFLNTALHTQMHAVQEGPKVKKFTLHDLKNITPLTIGQKDFFTSYFSGNNIVANGSAGTGKTFCALYLALTDLLAENSKYESIIIVRSAVQTRNIGFLPGSQEEKLEPFETPYKDILSDLLKKHDAYDSMKATQKIKFMPTSFVRGLTWNNCIVIIDEIQNCQFHEINSVITRLGDNSKLIICGDIAQNDLVFNKYETSGFEKALGIFSKMSSIDIINFTQHDIVRSLFVKEWICAVEDNNL